MAGVRINIDSSVQGGSVSLELRRALDWMSLNWRALHKSIGAYLVRSIDRRFTTETAPDGQRWQPLSKARKKQKRREGLKSKILSAQGRPAGLRGQILYQANEQNVEVGTNLIYGAIHQLGGQAGRGLRSKIPARPYLGLSPADHDEIQTLLIEEIERTIGT